PLARRARPGTRIASSSVQATTCFDRAYLRAQERTGGNSGPLKSAWYRFHDGGSAEERAGGADAAGRERCAAAAARRHRPGEGSGGQDPTIPGQDAALPQRAERSG